MYLCKILPWPWVLNISKILVVYAGIIRGVGSRYYYVLGVCAKLLFNMPTD